VWRTLRGQAGPYDLVVNELRVPRTALGALVGAALGPARALVQTVTRNPLAFVALTAPQLARRLTRTPHLPLLTSALTGAVVLAGADLAARTLLPPLEIPVGALTALVGGPYLLWLLGRRSGDIRG
jgi:iron complex transport system permease protein